MISDTNTATLSSLPPLQENHAPPFYYNSLGFLSRGTHTNVTPLSSSSTIPGGCQKKLDDARHNGGSPKNYMMDIGWFVLQKTA